MLINKNCYIALIVAFSVSTPVAMAETAVPYEIEIERKKPNEPLRKSTIMTKVKEVYPGKVVSILPDNEHGEDCHIVKSMGEDGEFRIIHVAC